MMRIVYSCYGGAHSSPVAAALHLGKLPRDKTPTADQLLSLTLFDQTTSDEHGNIIPVGHDRSGNEIFVLGRGPGGPTVIRAVRSGMALSGRSDEDTVFIDTLVAVNTWMRVGGFLSRALGLIAWGRPLVIYGTQKAFPNLARLVSDVENDLATGTVKGDFPKQGDAHP